MNILYLTNRLPFPLTSGYLRQFYFIRELSQRHRVTLLSLVGEDCPANHIQAMEDCTERVITFSSRCQARNSVSKRWQRFVSAFRTDAAVSALCATVRRLLRQENYEAAFLHGLSTVPALTHLNHVRVVADLCDANSSRLLAAARFANPFRLPLILWDYFRARQLEQQFVRSRALLVFATWRDRQNVLRDTPRSGTVVPNGVDLEYWNRCSAELGTNTVVFAGALNYPPNADAALHLVQEILPLVRAKMPQVKLLLVGRNPSPRLAKAAHQAGVTLTGEVEDIRPYLDQASVFANPLRYGAGIQNKVLQALAMQVPVVASPAAVEGLRAPDGSLPSLDVASDSAGFAKLVCQQLAAVEKNRTPCLEGRKFVERHFCWGQSGQLLDSLIHTA